MALILSLTLLAGLHGVTLLAKPCLARLAAREGMELLLAQFVLRLVVESISQLAFRAISRGADVSRALIGARFENERGKQRKLKISSADKTPARMRAPRDCKNVEVNGSDAMPGRRYVPGG